MLLNPKFDPATLGSDRYPPLAGRNPKQYQNPNFKCSKHSVWDFEFLLFKFVSDFVL